MIALRRGASTVTHEDFMDAIMEVQAKKKSNLSYNGFFIYKKNN
jgi:26S proteasome regulatory subunit T5